MTVWYDYRAIAGQQAQRIKELEAQLANQDVEWDASHKKAAGMVDNLRARVAELEAAMGNLLLAAEHVSVFVNSRERIQSTTGKTWYEDQLAIARSVLNP